MTHVARVYSTCYHRTEGEPRQSVPSRRDAPPTIVGAESIMTLLMVFIGPLLRLGLLSFVLGSMAGADSGAAPRPLDVKVASAEQIRGPLAGNQHVLVDGKPFFPIGVSYHFTRHRDTWDEDLQAMRDLGLNTVRIDLGWRDVEPILPGRYRFGVLDEFLDRASRHGLYVVPVFSHTTMDLNTPLWFWLRYQDWKVVDQKGGSPLDDLPSVNHPGYRQGLRSYIEATVRHIRGHPAVLAYQLLNEPRYDQKRLYDYNPYSLAAFQRWLQDRYGSVDLLNETWSTAYSSFDEAQPLRQVTDTRSLEGTRLQQWSDWREFGYDNLTDFIGELARTVKGADPDHPVIVAEMAWWWWGEQPYTGVSPLHIYRDADIVGYDLYPDSVDDASYFLLTSDMLSRYWRKPVWVMEMNRKDGDPSGEEIQRFMAMALEGGASGVFYFQWRDDWRDGGTYGVLGERGSRRTQYGGLASAVRWLRGQGESLATAPLSRPDVYLVWPSSAVGEIIGEASPAWQVYETAQRLVAGGLRLGLVMEELVHLVDPGRLLTLRDGRLESGKDSAPPSPARTRGMLISDE